MTDHSGKIHGWRSLFSGIILGLVATYFAVFVKSNLFPEPDNIKQITCIPQSKVCVGASISLIDGLIGYKHGEVFGVTDFVCEEGGNYTNKEANIAIWHVKFEISSECKSNQYKIGLGNERKFKDEILTYIITVRDKVIQSIDVRSLSSAEGRAKGYLY